MTVLYIHEALYFGDRMSHTLLCLNQLQANGCKVEDGPKQFDAESAHAIIDPTGTLRMPLEMSGVISFLPTWRPTDKELETCETAAEAASVAAPADSADPASTEAALSLYVASSHMDVDLFVDSY
jgi:hypothetical protein